MRSTPYPYEPPSKCLFIKSHGKVPLRSAHPFFSHTVFMPPHKGQRSMMLAHFGLPCVTRYTAHPFFSHTVFMPPRKGATVNGASALRVACAARYTAHPFFSHTVFMPPRKGATFNGADALRVAMCNTVYGTSFF